MAVFPAERETRAAAPSLLDSIVLIRCRTDEAEGLSNFVMRSSAFGVSSVVLLALGERTRNFRRGSGPGSRDQDVKSQVSVLFFVKFRVRSLLLLFVVVVVVVVVVSLKSTVHVLYM